MSENGYVVVIFKIFAYIFLVLQTLTGESHNIWDITYEELKKLEIKSTLTYG